MAQSGFTPLQLYYSGTPNTTPLASNLQNGELAINIADGRLFYKDTTNTVQLLAQRGGLGVQSFSAGTTGLTPSTSTAGAVTLGGTLSPSNGGTGQTTLQSAMNVLAGALTSGFYLRGNGTNVVMSAIQASDVPTLNQNTTGTAGNVTGLVAPANGGTGQTTVQSAMNSFAGAVTSGQYLRGNGTDVVMSAIQASDVPTLNQNTTGTAALAGNVTGVVAVANGGTGTTTPSLVAGGNVTVTGSWPNQTVNAIGGTFETSLSGLTPSTATSGTVILAGTLGIASGGTGQTTKASAFNALSPIATTGDLLIGNGTNSSIRLPIGAASRILTSNGTTASWQTPPPPVPAGSNTQIQFNNAGDLSASSNLTWDGTAVGISGARFGADDALSTSFMGKFALANNTGQANNAFGSFALINNRNGSGNNAFGGNALSANENGSNNTAVGANASSASSGGSNNTAVGSNALRNNVLSSNNTAVGFQSAFRTTGRNNSAFGINSLGENTNGNYNIAIGDNSLIGLTTGSGNIAVGSVNFSGVYSPPFNITTENNRVVIGSTNVTNAYIQVAWTVVSDLRDKVVLGDVPHGLEFVKKLKPISYKFKASRDSDEAVGATKYGYGAQDILDLEGDQPVVVDVEVPEKLKLTDQHLLPIFSNAIRELAEQVEQLKAEIEALKGN